MYTGFVSAYDELAKYDLDTGVSNTQRDHR